MDTTTACALVPTLVREIERLKAELAQAQATPRIAVSQEMQRPAPHIDTAPPMPATTPDSITFMADELSSLSQEIEQHLGSRDTQNFADSFTDDERHLLAVTRSTIHAMKLPVETLVLGALSKLYESKQALKESEARVEEWKDKFENKGKKDTKTARLCKRAEMEKRVQEIAAQPDSFTLDVTDMGGKSVSISAVPQMTVQEVKLVLQTIIGHEAGTMQLLFAGAGVGGDDVDGGADDGAALSEEPQEPRELVNESKLHTYGISSSANQLHLLLHEMTLDSYAGES